MVLFCRLSRFLLVPNFLGVAWEAAIGFVQEKVEQPQNVKTNVMMLLGADKNEHENRPKPHESV